MSDKPEVGFQFGVEGDQSLLVTIQALRGELKNLQQQQQSTASSAELLQNAWRGLIQLAGTLAIAKFAHDVFDTAVALGKLSQITGVTTETLSVYYKAAKDVGVEHEAIDKGLGRLSRAFVMLNAGNSAAAAGFRLLHLSAKDFIGLSPDEKVRKVTDAFAGMKDGPEKAAAAIALLGKAGQTLIPVFNQLGGTEFAKLAEQAQRLGLIFTTEMAEGALRAKVALADLEGVAEGATAQFETGLLPAAADAADGLVAFADKSSNGFKGLGEITGSVLKRITLGLTILLSDLKNIALAIGVVLETIGREVINLGVTFFKLETDLRHPWETLKNGAKEAAQGFTDAWKAVADSIEDSNARLEATFGAIFQPKERKQSKATGEPGDIRGADLNRKGMDRAELSGLKQRTQDELALYKALTQRELEEDKRAYDQGLMSLADYFDRRRGAIQQGFVEEAKSLGAEKLGLQALLAKTEAEGGKTPQQQLANQIAILGIKQQIAHVDAQEAIELTKRDTELEKNETERAKAKQDHLLKELELQKKLADLEGDRAKSAQLANQIEDLQIRKTLEQLGRTEEQINAELARTGAARAVRSGGEAAKQDFSGELSSFDNRKAAIEARAAAGPLAGGIEQYQAERELKALYEQEIPLLEQKVQKLREQAALAQAGSDLQLKLTKEADDEAAKIQKMRLEMAKLTNQWKTEVQSAAAQMSHSITTGFNGWLQGSQKFGAAMKQMWNSIVMTALQGIENITAKWIQQHIIMAAIAKITKFLGFGGDDGDSEKRLAKASGAIQIDAAQASADVFAQAIAQIPFPANLAAAPALAAATEAQVMAFQAQAAGGGAAGAAGAGLFAAGGYVARKSLETGGFLRGPGSSTSDSIPAMLSDGEYVVNAKAVRDVGVETLEMINRGALNGAFLPPIRHPAPYSAHGFRYASGGLAKTLRSSGAGNGAPTIHNHNTISSSSIDSKDFRDHIDDHMDYIADALKARMRNFRL